MGRTRARRCEQPPKKESEKLSKTLYSSTRPPSPQEASALAAVMPGLAGKPLEAPLFFNTSWKPGQKFKEEDDPDRTALPWEAPDFLGDVDPHARARTVTVEELPVPDKKISFARVLRGVLTEEECASLLSRINGKGFTPALLNVGHGMQVLAPYVRDGHRIVVDCPVLTEWLLDVLCPHLPATMYGSSLEGLNERCRFLCYTPGQRFEAHTDGCYRRPKGHPKEDDISTVTVQLYLHDVPASHGGATTFFPKTSSEVGHQPEAGSVLLFTQDLLHEGSLVTSGVKFTLRTEAMYTSREAQADAQT